MTAFLPAPLVTGTGRAEVRLPPGHPANQWPNPLIMRSLLIDRLVSSDALLVVVSAPAGYGKTTLVIQWAASDERPFAWVKFSPTDNRPNALAEHLTRALLMAGVLGEPGTRPSVTLAGRRGTAPQTGLDATLTISSPVVIVVDDAQELVARPARSVLERLLDQLPAQSKLVMIGRHKPGFPLARMRAAGHVQEIGADDLAFSPEEGVNVLEAAGVRLTSKGALALVERAEGWPTGLVLAAKSLESRRDPELEARRFDGDDRAVADYFAEVLDGLDADLVDFLVETSVLERFCAPLCDAVRQRRDSSRAISALSKANLFLVPLDHTGDWYRYRRLFAAFLQGERRHCLGDDDAPLHIRASHWCEEHGHFDRAVRHAYAAGDLGRFEALVWLATPTHLNNDHIHELASWLELPRPDQATVRPPIALATAWVNLALNGGETGPLIANLSQPPDARLPDGTPLAAALSLLCAAGAGHDQTDALAAATRAYDTIADDSHWKAFACLFAGTWLRLQGRSGPAEAMLKEGHQRSAITMPALDAWCLVQLAWLAMDVPDWGRAEAHAGRARAALESAGPVQAGPVQAGPVRGGAGRDRARFAVDATSAFLATRSGDIPAGHDYVQAALRERPKTDVLGPAAIEASVIAARALVLLSDHSAARLLLGQARAQAAGVPETGILAEKVADAERIVAEAYTASPLPDPLTPAEMRVLRYLPTYKTFAEISRDLIVSRTTVKTQALAVYRKLGVKSRSEAVSKAYQQGLLTA